MNIIFVASEAAPFVKTGGLADVAEALPSALSTVKENDITLFLPYYPKIKNNSKYKVEFIKSFYLPLSWRNQYVGIHKLVSKKKNFHVYFIDNEYYFFRGQIYGEPDDGERFAFFSKAILESILQLNLKADIIHCNDWQTALVPVFLHAFYQETLGNTKTVFTVHNMEYQGKADPFFLTDTLGLPEYYENTMMYDGCINFLKAAILTSDAITTVSETYAEEIRYPYYSHGLSPVINDHYFKISGIVNGINTKLFNPKTDKELFANYDINDYQEGKAVNKREIQRLFGLREDPSVPVIAMVTRLVSHKGLDLLTRQIDDLMNWDVQLIILGTGDPKYEKRLSECAAYHGDKFSLNLRFGTHLAQKIYAASDIYLMPSKNEPCGLSQLIAMRYGSIPVVNSTGGLKDTVTPFNPSDLSGTGFTFQSFNSFDMMAALERCLETYGGHKDQWSALVKNAMSYDSSWKSPAKSYQELYKKIISK